MATRTKTFGRHAFLPSGMGAFLKRRAGQFLGFFMVCLSMVLAAILITYHPTDPSWNLAIDGVPSNILAYPGAVLADGLLQTIGLAVIFLIIAIFGWGVRSMAAIPLKWPLFRVFALFISILLMACVAAQWTAPKTWVLPNSLGGALGDILNYEFHQVLGRSTLSFIIIGVTCSLLATILLILSMGITFSQLGKGFFNLTKITRFAVLLIYKSLYKVFFWGTTRLNKDAAYEDEGPLLTKRRGAKSTHPSAENEINKESRLDPIINTKSKNDSHLRITIEDRAIHNTDVTGTKNKTAIIWGNNSESMSTPKQKSEKVKANEEKPDHDFSNVNTEDMYDFDITTTDSISIGQDEYELPTLELLDPSLNNTVQEIDPEMLEESAHHLKSVLEEFGVRGEVVTVRPGPVVTMYEFKPAAGIKTSRVIGLADDIARSMSALSARIAVIPGRNVIGIELPNINRETVYLREILQSEAYEKSTTQLALILGKDIGGQPVIADLTRMPHLLVAGTTGSGKSVAVNTMILSLLYRLSPDRCKFIMIDPKMLELSVYDGIPHLLSPVVTDPKKAIIALKWAVREMESRYRAMSKLGVRNIDGYNSRVREARQTGEMLVRRVQTGFDPDSGKPVFENQPLDLEILPYIVVVVDEMADLMMVAGKEIESAVQRLAQMARAAGIHLIMATQRPSVDVITGTIKANFPTRISFQVTSKIDSRTILGEQGAEQLLGQGDMLYMAGGGRITRVHGPFVRDAEVERVVAFLKSQAEPVYIEGVTDEEGEFINFDEDGGKGGDALYNQAVELVLREGKASTSFIQRHLQIGYNKAAGIIETMEKNGIVSAANHVGKREILR